jgi:5-methylcytosine-specific restriction endonuclease McrA
MTRDTRYGSAQWKRLRLQILNRDEWRCRAVHDGCKYKEPGSLKAEPKIAHVHHLIDETEGGSFWDDLNLQATCRSFNLAERNRRQNQRAAGTIRLAPATKKHREYW